MLLMPLRIFLYVIAWLRAWHGLGAALCDFVFF